MPDFVLNAKKRKRRPKLAIRSKRWMIFLLLILSAVIFADQISKYWATEYLHPGEKTQILGDLFQLSLTYNMGGAMGTAFGSGTFYLATSLIVLGIVFYLTYTSLDKRLASLSLTGIAGGAIGNIIDRIRTGKVTDFLDFDIPDINLFGLRLERWWTFNFADAAITIGVIILLIYVLSHHRQEQAGA